VSATAAALEPFELDAQPSSALGRAELLARYRHLREIGRQHHSQLVHLLSKHAVMSQARRLGLIQGNRLVLGSADDLTLVFDLLIYTAPKDRSRAIDRYAKAAPPLPGTDATAVLRAMQQAQFAIITRTGRHPVAGLIVKDLFRGGEHWLLDEALESSLPDDMALATRLYTLDGYVVTAGVIVPVDMELVEDALADTPLLLRKMPMQTIDDRRFAEAIYRTAIESGVMEQVGYKEPIAEAS
jgi:hypothetical protein